MNCVRLFRDCPFLDRRSVVGASDFFVELYMLTRTVDGLDLEDDVHAFLDHPEDHVLAIWPPRVGGAARERAGGGVGGSAQRARGLTTGRRMTRGGRRAITSVPLSRWCISPGVRALCAGGEGERGGAGVGCAPSQGIAAVQIKNCEPFVPPPALAMLTAPGPECRAFAETKRCHGFQADKVGAPSASRDSARGMGGHCRPRCTLKFSSVKRAP